MIPLSRVNLAKEINYAIDDLKHDRAAGLTLALQLEQHKNNRQDATWNKGMELHTRRVAADQLARELSSVESGKKAVALLAEQEGVEFPWRDEKQPDGTTKRVSLADDYELATWYVKHKMESDAKLAAARARGSGGGGGGGPDFGDLLAYHKEVNDQMERMGEGKTIFGNRAYLMQANDPALLLDLNTTALTKEEYDATVKGLESERWFLTLNGSAETGQGILGLWQRPFYQRQFPVEVLDDDDRATGGADLQGRWNEVEAELAAIPGQLEAARKGGDQAQVEYLQSESVYLTNWKYAMARRNSHYLSETKIPEGFRKGAVGGAAAASGSNLAVKPRPKRRTDELPVYDESTGTLRTPSGDEYGKSVIPPLASEWATGTEFDRQAARGRVIEARALRIQKAVAALKKAKTEDEREAALAGLTLAELDEAKKLYTAATK